MYTTVAAVFLFAVAVNAAVIMPDPRGSLVTSERAGESFAYSIREPQSYMEHSQSPMMGKPLARTLGAPISMIAPGGFMAAGMPGMAHLEHMKLYGQSPLIHHGMTAYAAQPITYAGQPFLMGHHQLITDDRRVIMPQIKA